MSERAARQCGGKRRYRSERIADVAAERMQRKEQSGFHSYFCHYCRKWHIGGNEYRLEVDKQLPRRERYKSTLRMFKEGAFDETVPAAKTSTE